MLNNSCGKYFPKISIVTVVYNASHDLAVTIASVSSQSYGNIEFIVIDGKSSDGTLDVASQYSDSIDYFVSEPDQGIYDAMNKGLAAATGEYVHFLNAGDRFCDTNSLENIIRSVPGSVDVLYGDIILVSTGGGSRHHKAMPFTLDNLKKFGTGVLCHQAMLVNREIACKYDASYKYKGELGWYLDLFQEKPGLTWFHYEQPLVYYYLGGVGYQDFVQNRLEWYRLLISRFGIRSVFNWSFMKFIFKDFRNRYGF